MLKPRCAALGGGEIIPGAPTGCDDSQHTSCFQTRIEEKSQHFVAAQVFPAQTATLEIREPMQAP